MKTAGKYMIYKFVSTVTKEEIRAFFPPDNGSIRRFTKRHGAINDYLASDFELLGIVYVDEETYLNERLHKTVADYKKTVNAEMEARKSYADLLISKEVYLETIKLCKDFEWTCLQIIDKQISRLENKNYKVHSALAYSARQKYYKLMDI